MASVKHLVGRSLKTIAKNADIGKRQHRQDRARAQQQEQRERSEWDREHEEEVEEAIRRGLKTIREYITTWSRNGLSHATALSFRHGRRRTANKLKVNKCAAEILCEEFNRRGIEAHLEAALHVSIDDLRSKGT